MIFDFFKNNNDDKDAYKSIAKNAKEYGELYLQLFKLNAVGALSKFVSYLIVIIAGVMLLVTVLIFLAIILVLWLKNATGSMIYSLLIMSGIFVVLFLLLLLFRKKLMLNPIIKKQNIMKISQLITFLGGAFLGAIIALLLAPETGDETREKIKSKLEEKGIKLSKEQLDEFIDSIKEKLNLKKDQEVIIEEEPNTTEE